MKKVIFVRVTRVCMRMFIVVKSGIDSVRKNPIKKRGQILPYDIIKVFEGDRKVLFGRIKDLTVEKPCELYKALNAKKYYFLDKRQEKILINNLQHCSPDLYKQIKAKEFNQILRKVAKSKPKNN